MTETLSPEIVHCLYMDIVGFSLHTTDGQTRLIDDLSEIVRATKAFNRAISQIGFLCLERGDAILLIFPRELDAPVRCAVEISRALHNRSDLQLRMGIHSGPVKRTVDITGNTNFQGDGIIVAERAMKKAEPGHILVSARMAEDLSNFDEWNGRFREPRTVTVRHGLKLRLFTLAIPIENEPGDLVKINVDEQSAKVPPTVTKKTIPAPDDSDFKGESLIVEPPIDPPIVNRITNPMSWTFGAKCLFASVIGLTLSLWYFAMWLYVMLHDHYAEYFDHGFLKTALKVQSFVLVLWCLIAVASWRSRRQIGRAQTLVALTITVSTFELAYATYFMGLHTNPFGDLTIVAIFVLGLAMFDRRPVLAGLVSLLLILLCLTFAEQKHLIPYAPIFKGSPVNRDSVDQPSYLDPTWLATSGAVTFVMMLFLLGLLYFIINRWHDREDALACTSRQLVHANDEISRYIASQLVEQIQKGDSDAIIRNEPRRLTFFYSAINDFAAFEGRIELDELSEALNEYLSEMTDIAERYSATIYKFVGDAIMIFIGAPTSTTDKEHAIRTVLMAIEMQAQMRRFRKRWRSRGFDHPFHIRIGINSGQARIGNFGSRKRIEYTAIGRQVNLAARLQAQCDTDRVLVSHSTWLLIHDEIECQPLGQISVQGIREPLKVYDVKGAVSLGGISSSS